MTDLETIELAARRAGLAAFADEIARIINQRKVEVDVGAIYARLSGAKPVERTKNSS